MIKLPENFEVETDENGRRIMSGFYGGVPNEKEG